MPSGPMLTWRSLLSSAATRLSSCALPTPQTISRAFTIGPAAIGNPRSEAWRSTRAVPSSASNVAPLAPCSACVSPKSRRNCCAASISSTPSTTWSTPRMFMLSFLWVLSECVGEHRAHVVAERNSVVDRSRSRIELPFANLQGSLYDQPAAIPATGHERVEHCGDVFAGRDQFRQHYGIFDSHGGALCVMGRCRVRRVTDQQHPAALPGWRHQQGLERLVDHILGAPNALADLGRQPGMAVQAVSHQIVQAILGHPWIARLTGRDEHVH